MESISPSFFAKNSITSHLKPAQKTNISLRIGHILRHQPSSVELLSKSLNENPFQSDFWTAYDSLEYPLIALKAFEENRISRNQLSTVCLFIQAAKEYLDEKNIYSLEIRNGFYHWTALPSKLSETRSISIKNPEDEDYNKYLKVFFKVWNKPKDWENLHKAIAQIESKSERCLFLFPAPPAPMDYWSPMHKAISLATRKRLHPFLEAELDEFGVAMDRKLVLPSFSILEIFAKQYNPLLPIQLRPRFGSMTTEDIIKDRFENSHVVALEILGALLPKTADGRPTGALSFSMHDLYHAHRLGETSLAVKIGIDRILQLFLRVTPKTSFLEALQGRIVDSEFTTERNDYKFGTIFHHSLTESFWGTSEGLHHKNLILQDMAIHRSLWDLILKKTGGLDPIEEGQLQEYRSIFEPAELDTSILAQLFNLPSEFFSYEAPYLKPPSPEDLLMASELNVRTLTGLLNELQPTLDRLSEEEIDIPLSWSQVIKLSNLSISQLRFMNLETKIEEKGLFKWAFSTGNLGWDFLEFLSEYTKTFPQRACPWPLIIEHGLVEGVLQLKDLFIKDLLPFQVYSPETFTLLTKYRDQINFFPRFTLKTYFTCEMEGKRLYILICKETTHFVGDVRLSETGKHVIKKGLEYIEKLDSSEENKRKMRFKVVETILLNLSKWSESSGKNREILEPLLSAIAAQFI